MLIEARRIPIESRELPPIPESLCNPQILSEDELLRLKTWLTPVDESLWAKLQEQILTIRLIASLPLTSSERRILEDCAAMVNVGRSCIERHERRPIQDSVLASFKHRVKTMALLGRHWPFMENNSLYWRVVHEVDENLLLVMPREMLAARALAVLQDFKLNLTDHLLRKTWLGEDAREEDGPLPKAVKEVQSSARPDALLSARHVIREALHEVNEHSDRGFRQLALNMLMRTWSGILLVLFLTLIILPSLSEIGASWLRVPPTVSDAEKMGLVPPILLLLGAAGAVLANMVARKAFVVAAGPTRRYFVFYLLTRPVVGAFATFLLYLLLRSGLLPLAIPGGAGGNGATVPNQEPVWNFHIYSILAVAAGYSAERFLGATIDKLMTNLFKTADKSQRSAPAKQEGCEGDQGEDNAAA